MKFQILTYRWNSKANEPFVAIALGMPHPIAGDRFYGSTPKEARDRLIKAAQKFLDGEYPELTVTEVEIAPATVDKRGQTVDKPYFRGRMA